jgi:hypothetical protein
MRRIQARSSSTSPTRRAGPAGGRGRGAQHHRARPAGGHGRLQPGHDHRAAPGAPRDDRRRRAAQARLSASSPADRDPRAEGPIQSEVKSEMDKTQREYILREQLKAIQRELGEDDPQQAEINELRERSSSPAMPDEVKEKALKEIDRMSRIPSASPGGQGSSAPTSTGSSACRGASRPMTTWTSRRPPVLDEDHYGLEKIKERILEYLAVRKLAETDPQPHPAVRRPARRRQDEPRQEHRPRHGPQVRADEPGRHPRRGGDPRPPAHVHRRPARPDHPEHQDGRLQQPGVHARRDRQDRHGLPGRPVVRAARGPRPGAEQHLPGQLPRGAVRPLQGALHRHGEPARHRSRRRSATGWRSSSCPATRSRRRSRSPSGSSCRSSWRTTA